MSDRQINDRGGLHDLPLQDHRPDVDPEARNVPRALRLEKREAAYPFRYVAEGHVGSESTQRTVGDLQGGQFVPQAVGSERQIGSWSFALPAVTTEDEPPLEAPELLTTSARAGTRTRPVGPSIVGPPPEETRLVKFRPVRVGSFEPDTRYATQEAHVPANVPRLRKGTTGVVLASMEERTQVLLFFPTDPGLLIAVNRFGDPAKSSLVYDLNAQGEPDPDYAAPLHTAWRVVRPDRRCSVPTEGPALAWQLGVSGRDARSGHGWVTAGQGTELVDPTEGEPEPPGEPDDPSTTRTRDPTAGGTRTRPQEPGVGNNPDSVERPPGPPPAFGQPPPSPYSARVQGILDQIGALQNERNQVQAQIQRVRGDLARSGVPFGSTNAYSPLTQRIAQIDAEIQRLRGLLSDEGTRTRDGGDGTVDPGGGGTRVPGPVHALMGSAASGPLEVGGLVDAHQVGTDMEGRPVNAGHLSTGSLFRGGAADAPLEFQGVAYSNPDGFPFRSKVHLRPDPETSHQWVCGSAPGLWRWEAEVPYEPTDPEFEPPPQPPPGGSAPAGAGGAGGGAGGGVGVGPVTAIGRGGFGVRPRLAGDGQVNLAGVGGFVAGSRDVSLGGGRGGLPRRGYAQAETGLGLPAGTLGAGGVSGSAPLRLARALTVGGVLDAGGWPSELHVRGGDHGPGLRAKLGDRDDRSTVMPGRFVAAGGLALRARADGIAETDFARGGGASADRRRGTYQRAPDAVVLEAVARGDGGWDGWEYGEGGISGAARGTPRPAGAGVLPLPVGVELRHALDGDYAPINPSRTAPYEASVILAPGLTRLDFAQPSRTTTTGKGVRVRGDDLEGMTFVLLDADGAEQTNVRYRMGEGGHIVDGTLTHQNGDLKGATGFIIDPYDGIAFTRLAARNAKITALGHGFWEDDNGGGVPIPRYYDGVTDQNLLGGSTITGPGGQIRGFLPTRVDPTGTLSNNVNLLPTNGEGVSQCVGVAGTLIDAGASPVRNASYTTSGAGGVDLLRHAGTVAINSATFVVTGTGTSFLAELDAKGHVLTGTVTNVGTAVSGAGTLFLHQVAVGDLIGSSAHATMVRVDAIANNGQLTTSASLGAGATPTVVKRIEGGYLGVDIGGAAESRRAISSVDSATQITLANLSEATGSGLTADYGDIPRGDTHDAHTYAWVASGTGGVTAMISTQRTALLTPPATFVADSRRVGVSGVFVSQANLTGSAFVARGEGNRRVYTFAAARGATNALSSAGVTGGAWVAVDLHRFVPPTASLARCMAQLVNTDAINTDASLRARGLAGTGANAHPDTIQVSQRNQVAAQARGEYPTDGTPSQMEYRVTGAFNAGGGFDLAVIGFTESV